MIRALAVLSVVFFAGFQAAPKFSATNPDPNTVRPIEALDSVFIEELTWMEIRDAMKAGKNTVIIPTGGVEQNGPYLALGKHNYILKGVTEALARKLGNALVAPIVPFVPEGDINPPTSHMKYPGTISLTEETYQKMLTEICECFRTHGFAHIVLLGDSGGNQDGMKAVAERLSSQWRGGKTKVHFIGSFYDYTGLTKWVEDQGVKQVSEDIHDDFVITTQMLAVDPTTVRMKQRIAANKFTINGVALAPAAKSIEWGKKIIDHRADLAAQEIRRVTGG